MKIYSVIPITRGVGKETLTYFGQEGIPLGALVSVPLRKRIIPALVIGKKALTESKAEIRSSEFTLKKILRIERPHLLSSGFVEAAEKTARLCATTTGAILQSTVPKFVLEGKNWSKKEPNSFSSNLKKEFLVIQDTDTERYSQYKGFIRSEFARKSSVFFVLPTIEDIHQAAALLEKGIEDYTVILHSKLSKKEFDKAIKKIRSEDHPILIIGTPPFLSVEREDVKSIVLDRENSRSYRTQSRPYFDMRMFIRHIAETKGFRLLMGDLLLSVETLHREREEEYVPLFPLKFRMLTSAECLKVDMKLPAGEQGEEFRVLSRELESLIDKTIEDSERLFVFCGRKGLSPNTVCGDCGQVVVCDTCGSPITLYQREGENVFVCNHCGAERDSMARCSNCLSWKLNTLGIGIELVEKEIKKRFPHAQVLRIDKESVKTERDAKKIIKNFENTPGTILVGTELGLLYLDEPVENIAVASMDALFALPDFRIHEKIFYLLLTMRSKAQKVFLIQTRNGNERILDYALKGNVSDFYRDEIGERKKFSYPPFSAFVKITVEGKRAVVDKEMVALQEYFKDWEYGVFENLHLSSRGNHVLNMLFRFSKDRWPDEKFLEKASALPPQVLVKVDPESLIS